MSIKSNERGFSPLFIVLGLVVLGVLGFAGWRVYQNKNMTIGDDTVAITSFAECKDNDYPVQESYPEKCTGPDGKTFMNPDQVVAAAESGDTKPDNSIGIVKALVSYCKKDGDTEFYNGELAMVKTNMQQSNLYKASGNYISISAGCSVTEPGHSFSAIMKKTGSTWQVLATSTQGYACADVDGLGIPRDILELCYIGDSSSTRAPQ